MSNPGVVLTRARILEHVRDYTCGEGSDVIEQCMSCLRSKIDRPFRVLQLETVPGSGYHYASRPQDS
jgi:DNA-binding response OmpR family regulator